MSAKKESGTDKIPCPVCGKMISAVQGRTVHNKSKFHQDALKRQQEGEKPPEVKPPEVKPPEVKDEPEKPPEVKPPADNVNSGIAGKGKGEAKEKGPITKFLEGLFGDDEDDDDW